MGVGGKSVWLSTFLASESQGAQITARMSRYWLQIFHKRVYLSHEFFLFSYFRKIIIHVQHQHRNVHQSLKVQPISSTNI